MNSPNTWPGKGIKIRRSWDSNPRPMGLKSYDQTTNPWSNALWETLFYTVIYFVANFWILGIKDQYKSNLNKSSVYNIRYTPKIHSTIWIKYDEKKNQSVSKSKERWKEWKKHWEQKKEKKCYPRGDSNPGHHWRHLIHSLVHNRCRQPVKWKLSGNLKLLFHMMKWRQSRPQIRQKTRLL